MNIRAFFLLWVGLAFSSGCTAAGAPTVVPSPTTLPNSSPAVILAPPVGLLPTPSGNRLAPADVPACKDAQTLQQPVQFVWAGIDDIVRDTPETNWTYYRCGQSQISLSASYRQWMLKPPYSWIETYWEGRREATMGVYYGNSGSSSLPNRWLYLWFLPESSAPLSSSLVAAWWNIPKSC
jgi:hypothetical protein